MEVADPAASNTAPEIKQEVTTRVLPDDKPTPHRHCEASRLFLVCQSAMIYWFLDAYAYTVSLLATSQSIMFRITPRPAAMLPILVVWS